MERSRDHVYFIGHTPVVVAIKLGIEDIRYLAYAYTFGVLAIPAFLYAWSLYKVKNNSFQLGAIMLIIAAVYQNINLFAVGEFVMAYALVTCALVILVSEEELTSFDYLALILIAIATIRSYQSLIFLGPVLYVASIARMNDYKNNQLAIIILISAAFCFAAAATIAWWSTMFPRDPNNFANAIKISDYVNNKQFIISSIIGALYFFLIIIWNNRILRVSTIFAICCFAIILLMPSVWATPNFHYTIRVPAGVLLFGIAIILVIHRFVPNNIFRTQLFDNRIIIIPFILLCILSVPDVYHTLGWKQFLDEFKNEVNTHSGIIQDAKIQSSIYGWGWTYPTMSLLLRNSSSSAIVLNPQWHKGWQPFDPKTNIPNIPHKFIWH